MLAYFKSQQPAAIFAFFLVFLLLKIPFFLTHSIVPVLDVQNLWGSIGLFVSGNFYLNFFIAQLCLLAQAIWFNYLFHKADYHESNTMIPALYFAILTSLLPVFNECSIYIIINFILLLLFHTFISISIKESSKLECFNIGVIGGVLLIINIQFVFFIPFLFFIIYTIKPFRLNEYLILFFGIACPIYFALAISYLFDLLITIDSIRFLPIELIGFKKHIADDINLISTVIYLVFSFVSLRGILYSTGFKRRKNLKMLVLLFIGLVVIVFFNHNLDNTAFTLLSIPVAVFLTLFMLRIRKRRLGEILNAIFVALIMIVNIVRIFK